MVRLIQELLKKELVNELLFGKLSSGGDVIVDLKDDKLMFSYNLQDKVVLVIEFSEQLQYCDYRN